VLEQLRQDLERQQVQAEVVAVEHIPRIAGKARRVRPWSEREQLMTATSLLRREAP
jgi:hypothetical protein